MLFFAPWRAGLWMCGLFSYADLMFSCRLFCRISSCVCSAPWHSAELYFFLEDSEKSVYLFVCFDCSFFQSFIGQPVLETLEDNGETSVPKSSYRNIKMRCFLTTWYQDLFLVSSLGVSYTLKRVRLMLCIKKKEIWALGLSGLPFENFLLKRKETESLYWLLKVTFL